MGDKEQRRETGNKGRETRNREVRQGTEQRMGDKLQRSETGNSGWETRKGDKEQTLETGDIGR
jgi:hypothetical protein